MHVLKAMRKAALLSTRLQARSDLIFSVGTCSHRGCWSRPAKQLPLAQVWSTACEMTYACAANQQLLTSAALTEAALWC